MNNYYSCIINTLLLLGIVYGIPVQDINNRPIIGVLAQHFHPSNPLPDTPGDSFIAASYVNYLQAAGARVVPIKINEDPKVIENLLKNINGVLFPGGDSYVLDSPYQRNAKAAFDYSKSQKEAGNVFPLWGTCLGMQQLSALAAETDSILTASKGTWDASMKLDNISTSASMMENMPGDIREILSNEMVTYNAHYNCVSVEDFNDNKKLQNFFQMTSTNFDSNGKEFVSGIEGKRISHCAKNT